MEHVLYIFYGLMASTNYMYLEESFHLAVRDIQTSLSSVLALSSRIPRLTASLAWCLMIRGGLEKGVLLTWTYIFP